MQVNANSLRSGVIFLQTRYEYSPHTVPHFSITLPLLFMINNNLFFFSTFANKFAHSLNYDFALLDSVNAVFRKRFLHTHTHEYTMIYLYVCIVVKYILYIIL